MLLVQSVFAQVGDTFIVTQTIGNDTTPPTVPTALLATPVTTSQINLSWATSTDVDSSVAGYQVFRNDTQVATTTGTSYSDTGLTASTTYDYNVTAFDIFGNISARSATSSTTTLPIVVVPSTTPTSNETRDIEMQPIPLSIEDIEVVVSPNDAVLSFSTPSYTVAAVQVGVTQAYELTSLARNIYRTNHEFAIEGLTPQTRYYYKIVISNQRGETFQYEGTFITTSLGVTPLPENVRDFTAAITGNDVALTWRNPLQADFNRVRIVANPNFYPTDAQDGYLIYEGDREAFLHEGVILTQQRMYYAIFAINDAGMFSSGALARVVVTTTVPSEPATTTPETATATPAWNLQFKDLIFVQNNRYKTGALDVIRLNPYEPFTILLPYEKALPHLKSIIVTLQDPDDSTKTFAFLLRINEAKTNYEATIGALERGARFPLSLDLYDFKLNERFELTGVIDTTGVATTGTPVASTTDEQTTFASRCWWCWLIIALTELIIFGYVYRRTRPQQNLK